MSGEEALWQGPPRMCVLQCSTEGSVLCCRTRACALAPARKCMSARCAGVRCHVLPLCRLQKQRRGLVAQSRRHASTPLC